MSHARSCRSSRLAPLPPREVPRQGSSTCSPVAARAPTEHRASQLARAALSSLALRRRPLQYRTSRARRNALASPRSKDSNHAGGGARWGGRGAGSRRQSHAAPTRDAKAPSLISDDGAWALCCSAAAAGAVGCEAAERGASMKMRPQAQRRSSACMSVTPAAASERRGAGRHSTRAGLRGARAAGSMFRSSIIHTLSPALRASTCSHSSHEPPHWPGMLNSAMAPSSSSNGTSSNGAAASGSQQNGSAAQAASAAEAGTSSASSQRRQQGVSCDACKFRKVSPGRQH